MAGWQVFESAISYTSGAQKSYVLPPSPISTIEIRHTSGSMSGGASGNYLANTLIDNIVLRVGGDDLVNWRGDADADVVPNGIAFMREWNAQNHGVADTSEVFTVELPDAVPARVKKELLFKFNTIGNINDGDRTGYSGTVDIKYKSEDLDPKRDIAMYCNGSKHNMAARTGTEVLHITPTRQGFKLHAIMFKSEDNGTASNTTFSELRIKRGGDTLFVGSFAELQDQQKKRSGLACSTGFAIWMPKTPMVIDSSELDIEISATTGGTDKELHYHLIQFNV